MARKKQEEAVVEEKRAKKKPVEKAKNLAFSLDGIATGSFRVANGKVKIIAIGADGDKHEVDIQLDGKDRLEFVLN